MYRGRADVYYDMFVAAIWNFYRATKIKVLTIMMECYVALQISGDGPLLHQKQSVVAELQSLVDDICGSIPYHLGTKMTPGYTDVPSVEYPYVNTKATAEHRRAAAASGGWSLIEPYSEPLTVAIEVPYTRKGQREWLEAQLTRIAELYNVAPMILMIRQKIRQNPAMASSHA